MQENTEPVLAESKGTLTPFVSVGGKAVTLKSHSGVLKVSCMVLPELWSPVFQSQRHRSSDTQSQLSILTYGSFVDIFVLVATGAFWEGNVISGKVCPLTCGLI